MVDIADLESLKKEVVKEEGQVVESVNILFLDISSACIGYTIAGVNFTTKSVQFKKAGAVWLDPDWSHQQKYVYAYNMIVNYFWIVEQIDFCTVEQYSVNPKKMMGVNVVSEMQGVIKAATFENGVKVTSILPQTWRSILKIKKNADKDFKQPTKEKVLTYVQVPEQSISNITGQSRNTPSDVYDALAIGIAWLIKLGFTEAKMKFNNMKFNDHVGHLNQP